MIPRGRLPVAAFPTPRVSGLVLASCEVGWSDGPQPFRRDSWRTAGNKPHAVRDGRIETSRTIVDLNYRTRERAEMAEPQLSGEHNE
jgi:hypothetical protein